MKARASVEVFVVACEECHETMRLDREGVRRWNARRVVLGQGLCPMHEFAATLEIYARLSLERMAPGPRRHPGPNSKWV